MRVMLELVKRGHLLHRGTYEIDDNTSFGAACADVWVKVREQCAAKATSIGALMDTMHDSVIDELNGAEIRLNKLSALVILTLVRLNILGFVLLVPRTFHSFRMNDHQWNSSCHPKQASDLIGRPTTGHNAHAFV